MDRFDQRVQAPYPTGLDEWPPCSHRGLSASMRAQILRYLLLGWRAKDIVDECIVSCPTVYNMQVKIVRYGFTTKSWYWLLGCSSKLTVADWKALLNWLLLKDGNSRMRWFIGYVMNMVFLSASLLSPAFLNAMAGLEKELRHISLESQWGTTPSILWWNEIFCGRWFDLSWWIHLQWED